MAVLGSFGQLQQHFGSTVNTNYGVVGDFNTLILLHLVISCPQSPLGVQFCILIFVFEDERPLAESSVSWSAFDAFLCHD